MAPFGVLPDASEVLPSSSVRFRPNNSTDTLPKSTAGPHVERVVRRQDSAADRTDRDNAASKAAGTSIQVTERSAEVARCDPSAKRPFVVGARRIAGLRCVRQVIAIASADRE